MAVLIPAFSQIWKDRAESNTREDCRIIADAAAIQLQGSLEMVNSYSTASSSIGENAIVLLSWAYLFGDDISNSMVELCEAVEWFTDGAACRIDDDYREIYGNLPEDEYDKVLTALEEDQSLLEDPFVNSLNLDKTAYRVFTFYADGPYIVARVNEDQVDSSSIEFFLSTDLYAEPDGGALIMQKPSSGTILGVKGQFAASEGEILDVQPDENGILTVNGEDYIAACSDVEDYRFIAAIPVNSISSRYITSPVVLAACFTLLFILISFYAWFLRTDFLNGRVDFQPSSDNTGHRESLLKSFTKRIRLFYVTACVIISLLVVLILSLEIIDEVRIRNIVLLNDVDTSFQSTDYDTTSVNDVNKTASLQNINNFGILITDSPELKYPDNLGALSNVIGKDIYILDQKGAVDAASRSDYDLSQIQNKKSDWYALNPVLSSQANYITATVTDNSTGSRSTAEAIQRIDSPGMILFVSWGGVQTGETLFSDFTMPEGYLLLAITDSNHVITSSSNKNYTDKYIQDIGIDENNLTDGFVGDMTIDGKRYFTVISKHDNVFSCIAVNIYHLLSVYAPLVLLTIAAGIVLIAILLLLERLILLRGADDILASLWLPGAASVQKKTAFASGSHKADKKRGSAEKTAPSPDQSGTSGDEEKPKNDDSNTDTDSFYREQDGEIQAQRGAVGRWLHFATPFHRQTADEKLFQVLHILAIIAIIIVYVLNKYSTGIADNTLSYLLSQTWKKGFNVYGISFACLSALVIMVIATLIRRLIILIGKNFGSRGETIARLLDSFITYVSAITAIAMALTYLGVNTTAIITSVGIVGLGLTLGAKDLITDILAGISIVFEGEFRKDDIVEINGFRGVVEEIGIRTTKVAAIGNVKIFRNSEVSGVMNLTQRHSFASIFIQVARSEPLEKVELIFAKRLPKLQDKYPQAVAPIEVASVTKVTPFSVTLLIQTKCREQDRIPLENSLLREVDLIMEQEHIMPWGSPAQKKP